MSKDACVLTARMIRNFNDVPLQYERRDPLYESHGARLGTNTVAQKLGASVDIVAPGKRSCPYHFHYAQEEMFVILEGVGTPARGGRNVADQKRRRHLHSARPRVSASDHQHLGCTAEVPVHWHPRNPRSLPIPGFRQISGDGHNQWNARVHCCAAARDYA